MMFLRVIVHNSHSPQLGLGELTDKWQSIILIFYDKVKALKTNWNGGSWNGTQKISDKENKENPRELQMHSTNTLKCLKCVINQ